MKSSIGIETPNGESEEGATDEAGRDFAHDGEPASPGTAPRGVRPARAPINETDEGLTSTQEPDGTVVPPPPN